MDINALFNDTSWRGRLADGKGSFRGVPFRMIEDTTLTGGRRIVRHEYPLRDEGLTERYGPRPASVCFYRCCCGG
ncbi:DNA circularization N-terminal domain-containing protein [Erwinia tracheiphila]|uniref:DNA circularization N-terminal domain-containing protein n=1 Tax=Erwinia tracheiphila TaxID=65700 RepID=UPI0020769404|nr:DNA circularization N-terminal domain-containing protein [Erwinia tracheiphila]